MFPSKLPLLPVSAGLRLLPDAVHAELLSRLFNHLLKGQYLRDQLVDLDGKRICIEITDTRNRIIFTVRGTTLQRAKGSEWDVCIRGALEEFWKLAARAEDPDTLFFNRRLAIEGETETGLYLKNLLDALDFDRDAHLEAVLGPRLAAHARRLLDRTGVERRLRRLLA